MERLLITLLPKKIIAVAMLLIGSTAFAQTEEVVWSAKPVKKDAIYKTDERIVYKVDIKNNYKTDQSGTLSCALFSADDKEVVRSSMNVSIKKNSSNNYNLNVPARSEAGMYRVQVMLNVSEYDDTIRRAIGVDPQEIKSKYPKPADFDAFWEAGKAELAKIKPNYKVTAQPDMSKNKTDVFLVEMKSIGNITVRGWLALPKGRKKNRKLPVWIILPGYGGEGVKPVYGSPEMAVLSFNVRGHGNSKDVIHTGTDAYATTDVENRNKYVFRGAILDCIRAVDFVNSRDDLDSTQVLASGASMGGYLSIALASLDPRVKLCSANNPIFCDFRALAGSKEWPMKSFVEYSRKRRIAMNTLFYNLDYFDLKNFSEKLNCPSLIGIGLLDNLAPPANEYAMLNNIPRKYKLFVYPELAHEVPPSIYEYLSNWVMDQFGLF